MRVGKVIAVLFFASWLIGMVAFVILRPAFKRGKELLKAAEIGNMAQVRRLLDDGASVQTRDRDGHTALWYAVYYNRHEMAEALLAKGADPNTRGMDGMTALMWAATNASDQAAEVLLKHGANPNAISLDGRTALSYATADRQKPVRELLLKAGAK